jgi:hypothetical protein
MFPLLQQINESVVDYNQAAAMLIGAIKGSPRLSKLQPGQVLYRGYGNEFSENGIVFTKEVRMDRKPRDLHIRWHELMDNFFKEKFGIPFRSASVFTSGSKHSASMYGIPHIVIPEGNFKFCWSPQIQDPIYEAQLRQAPPPEVTKLHDNGMMGTYRTTDLKRAINSECEVMVHCPKITLFSTKLSNQHLQGITTAANQQLGSDIGSPKTALEVYDAIKSAIYG